MLPAIFLGGKLDDGSRLAGIDVHPDTNIAFDASTNIYLCDADGTTSIFIRKYDKTFAHTLSRTTAVTGSISHDAIAVNGSLVGVTGRWANGTPLYYPGMWGTNTTVSSQTFETSPDFSAKTSSTSRGRAACADASTGVVGAGINNATRMFIASYTSGGTLSWLRFVEPTTTYFNAADIYDVALNLSTGDFVTVGSRTRTSDGQRAGIIWVVDSSGAYRWGHEVYTSGGADALRGVCCDASGNIYVAFSGSSGCAIIKFDSSGTVTATLKLASSQTVAIQGIDYINGEIVAFGQRASTTATIIFRVATTLSSPTANTLTDSGGAMSLPRNVHGAHDGSFYYFNTGMAGSDMLLCKISSAVLAEAGGYYFGNRFTVSAPYSPTTDTFTITTTALGGDYTTASGSSSVDPGLVGAISSISAPAATDYYPS